MATQKELAKLAGVSAGTVSHVISGSKFVSDQAKQKVLQAIEKLGYRPNLIARSLKTSRTRTLGIVIPWLTFSFFPKLIRGAQFAAREHGYLLMVLDSQDNECLEEESIAQFEAQRVDGLLLIPATPTHKGKKSRSQTASGSPIVYMDRVPPGLKADSIRVDGKGGAEMAVAHLMQRGHRRIALISDTLALPSERERVAGYRSALAKAGIRITESLMWEAKTETDIGRVCLNGLLRSRLKPTALFATNGGVGLEALASIYGAGMSTPDDVAFATFDEVAAAEFFQPAVTCVVQPTFEIGRQAVELLLKRINGDSKSRYQEILLPPKLVVRASSSPKRDAESASRSQQTPEPML